MTDLIKTMKQQIKKNWVYYLILVVVLSYMFFGKKTGALSFFGIGTVGIGLAVLALGVLSVTYGGKDGQSFGGYTIIGGIVLMIGSSFFFILEKYTLQIIIGVFIIIFLKMARR